MTFAVCINCGAAKKRPIDQCARCHFKPETEQEKAKSLILSTAYEIDGEYRGKSIEELKNIASNIGAGRRYEFDAEEIDSVIVYARKVMAIPARRLIMDGIKWIGPPILILLLVYLLLFTAT